jgi:hypothetical protein
LISTSLALVFHPLAQQAGVSWRTGHTLHILSFLPSISRHAKRARQIRSTGDGAKVVMKAASNTYALLDRDRTATAIDPKQ